MNTKVLAQMTKMMIFVLSVFIASVFTSCDKNTIVQENSIGEKCYFQLEQSLSKIEIKTHPTYGIYLSFPSRSIVKEYENFLFDAIKSNKKTLTIQQTYSNLDFIPLYLTRDSLKEKGIYYDPISSLLLNQHGVIEVEGRIYKDRGNNFIPQTPLRAASKKPEPFLRVYGCWSPDKGDTFRLEGEVKFIDPLWGDQKVIIISATEISDGKGWSFANTKMSHYSECDLLVDGRSLVKKTKETSDGHSAVFETLIAQGDKIQLGYCYATITAGGRCEKLQVQVGIE